MPNYNSFFRGAVDVLLTIEGSKIQWLIVPSALPARLAVRLCVFELALDAFACAGWLALFFHSQPSTTMKLKKN